MPRQAKSVIAWSLFSSLALVGCSAPPPPVTSTPSVTPSGASIELEYPGDFHETSLGLLNENAELRVGDDAINFTEVFPRPPRSFEVNDRPPKLSSTFQTRGWQTNLVAVAAVLVEDHVAATVITDEGVELARVEEEIDAYESRYGPATKIVNGDYRFAFWSDEGASLMIGNAVELNGKMSMTRAIGHPRLMLFMNMTLADAQSQVRLAQERREANEAQPEPTN
ncbi:MAG: hypothetical protein KF812_10580 [Fimbriimonadaceae bacterium]|nr:hypothetical protein [Fimbriimonadaceae bacterium]